MKFRTKWQTSCRTPRNTFLHCSRYLFFTIGTLALGYVGFVLVDAKVYQAYETWRFQQDLGAFEPSVKGGEHLPLPSAPPSTAQASRANAESLPVLSRGGSSALGRIEISAIDLAVMIMEGTDDETLRRGVGHISGTALPGQGGNVALAGHRDTFFRGLRNIQKDDEIVLTTLNGSHRYRVDSTQIVEPEDVGVLDDSDDAILTLVTCYPFSFVGSAPQRFIVRAHRSLDEDKPTPFDTNRGATGVASTVPTKRPLHTHNWPEQF